MAKPIVELSRGAVANSVGGGNGETPDDAD
jgi:hypothetical protein